jgi:hypothetical protein
MSRGPLHSITLPILVAADTRETADGESTCFPPGHTSFTAFRIVNPSEVVRRGGQIGKEERLYRGILQLARAYEGKDERAIPVAIEQVRPWNPSNRIQVGTIREDWTGNKKWEGARWVYSSVMTNALQTARLVTWWPYKGDRISAPAVYCPDWKTAAFVAASMGCVRICPKCKKLFVPPTDNVAYCTPAHGVAYRTALSRWRKKARQEKARRKALC